MTGVALSLRSFALRYPGSRQPVLEGVDLDVPSGRLYLLVGPSGAGKSTILRLITGLWDPRERQPRLRGDFRVLGQRVRRRLPRALRPRVQAVLQEGGLFDELDARQNVELALRIDRKPISLAPALIAQVGLTEPLPEISRFSGGMRKRLAVARALAGDPDLIVFDEPTAGLDPQSARDLAAWIAKTHEGREGRTTIVITHDVDAFDEIDHDLLRIDPEKRSLEIVGFDQITSTPQVDTKGTAKKLPEPIDFPTTRFVQGIGDLAYTFGRAILCLPPAHPGRCARSVLTQVVEAAFFVGLGSAVVGALATFFALNNNPLEGSFESTVISGLGRVLVAVLVPLIVGILFTARVSAGSAARLGSMTRSRQIDALRLLGLSPDDYLLTPGVWGSSLALPLATALGIVCASAGSAVAIEWTTPIAFESWARWYPADLDGADLRGILGKSVVSGFLVGVLTYHVGTGPKLSARQVARAVDDAIVLCVLAILGVHAAFTLALYA